MRTSIDALELELRRLPGVLSVGYVERHGEPPVLRLLAPDPADRDKVRHEAMQLAKSHLEDPIAIEIDDTVRLSVASRTERVQLLSVRPADSNEVEVHLGFGRRRTIGRGVGTSLAGAAEATIAALDGLGARIPFQVKAAAPLGPLLTDVVVVVLRSIEPGQERFGVASSTEPEEAVARATLDALNRFLAEDGSIAAS